MTLLKKVRLCVIVPLCIALILAIGNSAMCSGYSDVSAEAQRTAEAIISRHPELSTNNALLEKMLSIVQHYEKLGNTRTQSMLRAENDMIRNGLLLSAEDRKRQARSGATHGGVSGGVVESRVDGEFNGWNGNTIVRLSNGQIWAQEQYYYEYRYAYMPKVIVFVSDGRWSMLVDGTSKAVPVSRLK